MASWSMSSSSSKPVEQNDLDPPFTSISKSRLTRPPPPITNCSSLAGWFKKKGWIKPCQVIVASFAAFLALPDSEINFE